MNVAPTDGMRRGACPALSAPMMTGDGLLVRLALAEGGLTPDALVGLCTLAARHGNGVVEVTARGSFQIRGLTPASAPLLEADVAALELPLREGVPVETSPLAGLDPAELADPLPVVRAIRSAIENAGLSRRLGPKVSVVVDGGGSVDLSDLLADVRLTAVEQDGEPAWQVALGGTAATAKLVAILDEADAVTATLAILQAIATLGTAARGRDLAGDMEVLRFMVPPSVLPDISATRGEIGCRDGLRQSSMQEDGGDARGRVISSRVGEMSGRTEGGNVECQLLQDVIPLRDARFAISIGLPFGSIRAGEMSAFVKSAGADEIRLAPQRSLIAVCGSMDSARAVLDAARQHGLIIDTDDPRRRIFACPGAPACASGRIDTREIARRLAKTGLAGSVHVSGCAKGCAHPSPADMVLVGMDAGVALVRRGRAGDKPETIYPDADSALAALAALPEPAE